MKKILIAAVASTALMATPAFAAPSDSQEVVITAEVEQECSVGDPNDIDFGTLVVDENPGPTALTIGEENVDDQPLWVSCNYGAAITLSSENGGLLNAAGAAAAANDPDDFTNLLEYRLRLVPTDTSFAAQTMQTNFGGPGVTNTPYTAPGAFHNEARLDAEIKPSDNTGERPVAGDYTDTATITLGAV